MERTLTMTMEDALISKMGIAILTGAGLIDAAEGSAITTHYTENLKVGASGAVTLTHALSATQDLKAWFCKLDKDGDLDGDFEELTGTGTKCTAEIGDTAVAEGSYILVDYYSDVTSKATQIDIEPGKFGGNYYLEAETLMRDEATGRDDAAEFILPNCKIQSNFTFTMASSGDPSTFTFTVDAFPGVVNGGDPSKKVLCAIQIVEEEVASSGE